MKATKFLAVLLIGLAFAACTGKPGEQLPKEFQPSKATVDSVSYLLGINFGSFMANYDFGKDMNYSEIVRGIKDFVNAEGDFQDPDFVKQFKVDPNQMNDLFNRYLENRRQGVAAAAKEKSEKFLADNAKKADVVTTESGLQYEVLEEGNGPKPTAASTVKVHYEGTLIDGTVFDSSYQRGEPIEFPLSGVIKGWTEGLQLMPVGSKYKLYIPYELAYGERGAGASIPPYAALIFTVELLEIK